MNVLEILYNNTMRNMLIMRDVTKIYERSTQAAVAQTSLTKKNLLLEAIEKPEDFVD